MHVLVANALDVLSCSADREVQRILLELLNQMDGFDQNVNVKVREFNSKFQYLFPLFV